VALERAMPDQMLIVARRHPELYDYLSARFADDVSVTVLLDRRQAPRRRRALPAAAERRRVDRRARPEVDDQLRTSALAVVTAPTAAAAPAASEARRWVEAMQRGVKAVRGALDDHDRLQHETSAIKQENERLRAEIDRSGKELAELESCIGRAIEVVTDLRTRLNRAPDRDPAASPRPPDGQDSPGS
jgi:chromosome segregation ATPase